MLSQDNVSARDFDIRITRVVCTTHYDDIINTKEKSVNVKLTEPNYTHWQ